MLKCPPIVSCLCLLISTIVTISMAISKWFQAIAMWIGKTNSKRLLVEAKDFSTSVLYRIKYCFAKEIEHAVLMFRDL